MSRSDYLQKSKKYKGYHYSVLDANALDYLHRHTLEMFKQVKSIFDANGIRYMICGGTLLGAVGTQSFVPDFKLSYDFDANHSIGASYRYQTTLKYDNTFHSDYTVHHNDILQGSVSKTADHDWDVTSHNANAYYMGKMGTWDLHADGSYVHTTVKRGQHITEQSLELEDRTVNTSSTQDSRLYAGKLTAGTEDCEQAVRHGKAGLLVLAEDAGANTEKRARALSDSGRVRLVKTRYKKSELAAAVGRGSSVALVLVADKGLAAAFAAAAANALEQEDQI